MALGRRLRHSTLVLTAGVAPLLVGCGLLDRGSTLDDALEYLPADTFHVQFDDRGATAERLGFDDIDPRHIADDDLDDYLKAFDDERDDAVAGTELTAYLKTMQHAPINDLDIEWQASAAWGDDPADPSGQGYVWKVGEDLDFDALASDLVDKGYDKTRSGDLAVYEADPADLDATNTYGGVYPAEMTSIMLDEGDELVAVSYSSDPLQDLGDVIDDDADSLADTGSLDGLVESPEDDPEVAVLTSAGPALCSSAAAPVPQDFSAEYEALGSPKARGIFISGDDAALLALAYDSEDAAKDDAEAREALVEKGVDAPSLRPFDDLGDFDVRRDGKTVLIEESFDGGARVALEAELSGGGPGYCVSGTAR